MLSVILFLAFLVKSANSVIYHLNETEYHRMPALFGLDNYEPCMCEEEGVYCLAKFKVYSDQENNLGALIREYSDFDTRHFNHSYIDRGICVTKTCRSYFKKKSIGTNVELNEILEKCFNASLWRDYQLKAKLSNTYYCNLHDESDYFDMWDGVFTMIIISILILNIVGSLYENAIKKPGKKVNLGHTFLSSFSLQQNWKWLITPESANVKVERLQGLHGIRPIVTFLMIFSHSIFIICTFTDNPQEIERSYEKIHYQLIFNGLVLMQIIFVMSGFLLAYNLKIRTEDKEITWTLFPKVMFLRLCRLGPANAIMVFFTATWLRHLGSGPLWKLYVTDSAVKDCRKYWWHHMFYINNYANENSHCLIPTWHLAADTQLFIAGLILHIATETRGRKIALGLMLMAGIVSPVLHVLLQGLDPLVIVKPEFFRTNHNDTFYMMHTLGHNNLAAYIVGMITGYYVYSKQNCGDDLKRHKVLSILRWLVVPALIYVTMGGIIFYMEGYEVPMAFRLMFAATQRVVMSGVTAVAIIWLVFRFNDTLCHILEWRGWVVPSRLTYAVFLIHMDIVEVLLGLRTQLVHASFFYMLMNHFAIVVLAFVIALPFHLTVEAPINRMVKKFLNRDDITRLGSKKYD